MHSSRNHKCTRFYSIRIISEGYAIQTFYHPNGNRIGTCSFNIGTHFGKHVAEKYYIGFFCCISYHKLFGTFYSTQNKINCGTNAAWLKCKLTSLQRFRRKGSVYITLLKSNIYSHSLKPFQMKIYWPRAPRTAAGQRNFRFSGSPDQGSKHIKRCPHFTNKFVRS